MIKKWWSRQSYENREKVAVYGGILTGIALTVIRSPAVWSLVMRITAHWPL